MSLRPTNPSYRQTADALEKLASETAQQATLKWELGELDEFAYAQQQERARHLYDDAADYREREVAFWQRHASAAAQVLSAALKPEGLNAEAQRYARALHAAITARCPPQVGVLEFYELLEDFEQDITPAG